MDIKQFEESEISTNLVVRKKKRPQKTDLTPKDCGEKENFRAQTSGEALNKLNLNASDAVSTSKKDIVVDKTEEEILTSDSEPSVDGEGNDADSEDDDDFFENDLAENTAEGDAEVEDVMEVDEENKDSSDCAEDAEGEDEEECEDEEEEEEEIHHEKTQEELEESERKKEEEELAYQEYEAQMKCDIPSNIDHEMPLIFWHDRKQIMSVHCQPVDVPDQFHSEETKGARRCFKMCTASVQHEVRVWEVVMSPRRNGQEEDPWAIRVNFLANLEGHTHPLNFAMYSPNGEFIASGDVTGTVIIWKIFPREEGFVLPDEPPLNDEKAMFDIPINKENWKRAFLPIRHEDEVNCAVFSPNSQFICTASEENAVRLFKCENGKNVWKLTNFRRKITGITWDPNGLYIVTLSTDQRLDIILAQKGHRLRTCHSVKLPDQILDNGQIIKEMHYKFFFDQHVYAFTRTPQFTPCGELLITPAAQLENDTDAFYGVYIFRRCDFDNCMPYQMFRTARPTVMISVMSKKLALRTEEGQEPFVDLPYRYVFAALCTESIYIFDTQYPQPIAYLTDLSYDNLTSISWSLDGKVLCVSSLEGYNHFIHFRGNEFDNVTTDSLQTCELPILQKPKEEKVVKPGLEEMVKTDLPEEPTEAAETKTPKGRKKKKDQEDSESTTPSKPKAKTPRSSKKKKEEETSTPKGETSETDPTTPKPLTTPKSTKAENKNQKKILDFFSKPRSQPSTPKSTGRLVGKSISRPSASEAKPNDEDSDIQILDVEEKEEKAAGSSSESDRATPKRRKPAPARKAKTAATTKPSSANLDSSSDDADFEDSGESEDSEASQAYDSADEVSPVEVSSSDEEIEVDQ